MRLYGQTGEKTERLGFAMTALVEDRSTQPSGVVTWRSAHIHYHDTLDAVRPLLDRVSADVGAAYWTRHWRRGPHVDLQADFHAETFR